MALWRSPVRSRYGPLQGLWSRQGQSHRLSFFHDMTHHATTIQLRDPETLTIDWSDGHTGVLPLRFLRDECPCAGCKGETILFESYAPPAQPELPGKYTLASAEPVGHYALQLSWGDGHATGMYTWESLRSICQCELCVPTASSRDTQ